MKVPATQTDEGQEKRLLGFWGWYWICVLFLGTLSRAAAMFLKDTRWSKAVLVLTGVTFVCFLIGLPWFISLCVRSIRHGRRCRHAGEDRADTSE